MELTKYDRDVIEHKVHFENEVRKIINIEGPRLKGILEPLVGHQLVKVDNTLLKKFVEELKLLEYDVVPLTSS